MKLHRLTYVVFLLFLGVYLLGNHLLPVTDPVESNYALTAKEMVLSGDWLSPQIYGHYWYDKPIMIYWLLSLSYSLFGITDFAARLPSALFGAMSVAFLYQGVRTVSGKRLSSLGAAFIMGTSLIVWIISHGIITDMVLLFATVGTFYFAYRGFTSPTHMAIAYGFAGLGVLTKGPVGLVLPGLLFLIYAGVKRSWTLVKALFPWQGLLLFLLVVIPWYGYMYIVHGMDFINGFLGLHNITRATQSEHPEVNHWWYYLPIFLGGSLPWTGAILYGMYRGWKERTDTYLYTMVLGWGTILFYTLMATKYPTYALISVIPFSILGMWGLEALQEQDASYTRWWWLLGPTLLLWWAFGIASFWAPWGFWWILRAFVVGVTVFMAGCYWYRKRWMMPFVAGAGTLVILTIVLLEGLVPLMMLRSSVPYHAPAENFHGTAYYYGDYATSIPYYTDVVPLRISHGLVKVAPQEEPKTDKVDAPKSEGRSEKWSGKDVMPQISAEDFVRRVKAGEPTLVFVNRDVVKDVETSEVGPYLHRVHESEKVVVFRSN